jgi:predicted transposase YdaD
VIFVYLLRGVLGMRESSFYQMILEEGEALGVAKGKVEEARRILFIIGWDRWGEPDPLVIEAIESLDDLGQVEALVKQTYRASSWEELLAESPEAE